MLLKKICFFGVLFCSVFLLSSCSDIKHKFIYSDDMIFFETNEGNDINPMPILRWKATELPVPLKEGYNFLGWFKDPDFSGEEIKKVQFGDLENITLYAKWEIKTYHVYYGIMSTPVSNDDQPYLYPGETIIDASIGKTHVGAVTSYGRLFMWGNNNFGQIGDGTLSLSIKPVDITLMFNLEFGEKIIMLDLGFSHSLAVTSSNRIFSWGNNEFGQLGNKTFINEVQPYEITDQFKFNDHEIATKIACGFHHNILMTSENRIFTWGGKIGPIGGSGLQPIEFPSDITPFLGLDKGEMVDDFSLDENLTVYHTNQNRLIFNGRKDFQHFTDKTLNTELLSSDEYFVKFITYDLNAIGLTNQFNIIYYGPFTYDGPDGKTIWEYYTLKVNDNIPLLEGEEIIDLLLGYSLLFVYTSFDRYIPMGYNIDVAKDDSIENRIIAYSELNKAFIDEGETVNRFVKSYIAKGFISSHGRFMTWGSAYGHQLGYTNEYGQNTPKSVFSHVDLWNISEFKYGQTLELLIPNHEDLTFDGWYVNPECTSKFDPTKEYQEDLYLYDKWI